MILPCHLIIGGVNLPLSGLGEFADEKGCSTRPHDESVLVAGNRSQVREGEDAELGGVVLTVAGSSPLLQAEAIQNLPITELTRFLTFSSEFIEQVGVDAFEAFRAGVAQGLFQGLLPDRPHHRHVHTNMRGEGQGSRQFLHCVGCSHLGVFDDVLLDQSLCLLSQLEIR